MCVESALTLCIVFGFNAPMIKKMAEETAIVPSENATQVDTTEHACIPGTDIKYILPFGKDRFYVPAEAVASYPKEANMCEDRDAIVTILTTKAVGSWGPFCDPDKLIKLNAFDHQRGESFSCIYTTFGINGESSSEERILRQISAIVADKNFGTWRSQFSTVDFNESMETIEQQAKEYTDEAKANEFKENSMHELELFKKRLDVLNWTKTVDSPVHSSINPSFQGWTKIEKSSDDFKLKICSKAESKKSKADANAITTSTDADEEGEAPPAKVQKTANTSSSKSRTRGPNSNSEIRATSPSRSAPRNTKGARTGTAFATPCSGEGETHRGRRTRSRAEERPKRGSPRGRRATPSTNRWRACWSSPRTRWCSRRRGAGGGRGCESTRARRSARPGRTSARETMTRRASGGLPEE